MTERVSAGKAWVFSMVIPGAAFTALDGNAAFSRRASATPAWTKRADNNPRVAAILNLVTNGFGYLDLGSKGGLAIVLAMVVPWRITNAIAASPH